MRAVNESRIPSSGVILGEFAKNRWKLRETANRQIFKYTMYVRVHEGRRGLRFTTNIVNAFKISKRNTRLYGYIRIIQRSSDMPFIQFKI